MRPPLYLLAVAVLAVSAAACDPTGPIPLVERPTATAPEDERTATVAATSAPSTPTPADQGDADGGDGDGGGDDGGGDDVATATPTATVIPSIQSAGTGLRIGPNFCFDLDAGVAAVCSGGQQDFRWEIQPSARYLVPRNGATLAVWGSGAPGYGDCATAPLSPAMINASNNASNQVPEGTHVCARTSEGRVATFQIVDFSDIIICVLPGGCGPMLTIDYVTWAP